MIPRPRFTTKLTRVRNAVLGVVLRPFRWFSAGAQLAIGFTLLVILTTLLLTRWPLTTKSIGLFILVLASYFVVWRFVESREANVDLSISKRRAFALVGSAIMVETAVMRVGFIIAVGLAAQSTQPPLNDPSVWAFTIPFATASLLVIRRSSHLSARHACGTIREAASGEECRKPEPGSFNPYRHRSVPLSEVLVALDYSRAVSQ